MDEMGKSEYNEADSMVSDALTCVRVMISNREKN